MLSAQAFCLPNYDQCVVSNRWAFQSPRGPQGLRAPFLEHGTLHRKRKFYREISIKRKSRTWKHTGFYGPLTLTSSHRPTNEETLTQFNKQQLARSPSLPHWNPSTLLFYQQEQAERLPGKRASALLCHPNVEKWLRLIMSRALGLQDAF